MTGWRNIPLETNTSKDACVVKIHLARNLLAHGRLKKSNTDFQKILKLIGTSMQFLGCDKKIIQEILNTPSNFQVKEIIKNKEADLRDLESKNLDLLDKLDRFENIDKELWFDVMPLIPSFTGRTEDVKNLHEVIKHLSPNHLGVVLSGLPGTGKTTLAQFYCYEYREAYENHVVWINASSIENMRASFLKLALHLGIVNDDIGKNEVFISKIYKYFNNTKALFIFDNCEELEVLESFVCSHLSPSIEKPTMLLTSKRSNWGQRFLEKKIAQLNLTESIDLLRNGIPPELIEHENYLTLLAERFDGYPLALQQVIAYIRDFAVPVNEHLKLYDVALLSFPSGDSKYQQELSASLKMIIGNLQELNDTMSINVLSLLSFLDCTNIDAMLISEYLKSQNDYNEKVLTRLSELSLIRVEINYLQRTRLIVIHSLVQKYVVQNLSDKEKSQTIEDTMILLSYFVKKDRSLKLGDPNVGNSWLHHITHMFRLLSANLAFITKLSELKKIVAPVLTQKGNERIAIEMLNVMKNHYCMLFGENSKQVYDTVILIQRCEISYRSWKAALKTTIQSEELAKKLYKNTDSEKINAPKHNRALCLSNLGKTNEAIRIYNELFDSERLSLTCIDGAYVSGINLATELHRQNRYNEAIKVYETLLKSVSGIPSHMNHVEYYEVSTRRIKLFSELGKHDESIKMMYKLLEESRKYFGNQNFTTINLKHELGELFIVKREYKKGLTLLQEVSREMEQTMENNHPIYLDVQLSCASCLQGIGKISEALTLFEDVKQRAIVNLGSEHDNVNDIDTKIASCYFRFGKYRKALNTFNSVITTRERNFDDMNQRKVLATKKLYAYTLYMTGDYGKALSTYNSLKEACCLRYGEDHVDVFVMMNGIGLCKEKIGFFEESLHIHNQVLTYCNKEHSHKFSLTKGSLFNRAICWLAMGRIEEANCFFLNLYNEELGKKEEIANQEQYFVLFFLGVSYVDLCNIGEGRKHLSKAFELSNSLVGKHHIFTLRAAFQLARCDFDEGNKVKAEKSCRDILAETGELSPYHLLVVKSKLLLASCLNIKGDTDEAIKICDEAIQSSKDVLLKSHPVYKLADDIINQKT